MSKSNISEPFLLATYTSTIRGTHLLRKPGVYATVSQKFEFRWPCHSRGTSRWCTCSRCKLFYIISHKWVWWITTCLGIFIASCDITYDGTGHIFFLPTVTSSCYTSSVSTTYAVIATSSEFSSSEESGRVLWVCQDDESLKAKEKQS